MFYATIAVRGSQPALLVEVLLSTSDAEG